MTGPRGLGFGLTIALLAAISAFTADRSQPPKPGPPKPIELPPVAQHTLSNGLPVFVAEMHELPVVHCTLVVRSGAAADPMDRPGLASLTADMLDEGAAGQDALALADALDYLGAQLETGSSWDASSVDLHVPIARFEPALLLMAQVVQQPDFPEKDLERVRRQRMTQLLQARDDADRVAASALSRAVFGVRHRYGLPAGGDATTLAMLGTADLRAFHSQRYRPSNAAMIVVGDVTPAMVLPLLERDFGAWPGAQAPRAPDIPEPPQVKERAIWLVDRPGSEQSAIRVGRVGPSRAAPDFAALEVMNALLGGSFTSRLNDNLRERHGYSYGAYSYFDYRRTAGAFVALADVQTQSTAASVAEILKELTRIRTPATPLETERARNYLAFSYGAEFETTRQIAHKLAEQWTYGLPEDAFTGFVARALAADVEGIRKAGTSRIEPSRLAIVVVGDRQKIEAPLRALGIAPVRVLTIDDAMGPAPRMN